MMTLERDLATLQTSISAPQQQIDARGGKKGVVKLRGDRDDALRVQRESQEKLDRIKELKACVGEIERHPLPAFRRSRYADDAERDVRMGGVFLQHHLDREDEKCGSTTDPGFRRLHWARYFQQGVGDLEAMPEKSVDPQYPALLTEVENELLRVLVRVRDNQNHRTRLRKEGKNWYGKLGGLLRGSPLRPGYESEYARIPDPVFYDVPHLVAKCWVRAVTEPDCKFAGLDFLGALKA
ncbi:hypothetical protein HK102_009364, partial [Quaeritorhiza haematococci]